MEVNTGCWVDYLIIVDPSETPAQVHLLFAKPTTVSDRHVEFI